MIREKGSIVAAPLVVLGMCLAVGGCTVTPPPLTTQPAVRTEDLWTSPLEAPRCHYWIDGSFDPSDRGLKGTERVQWVNTTGRPIGVLELAVPSGQDGSAVSDIQCQGKAARVLGTSTATGPAVVVIELASPVAPGADAVLRLSFRTRVSYAHLDRGVWATARWYPRLWWGHETQDDYEVRLQLPQGRSAYTTGLPDEKTGTAHASGVRTFGIALAQGCKVIEDTCGDVRIRCLYPAGAEECARLLVDSAKDAIAFYRDWLGFYPGKSLTIVPGEEAPKGGYPVATGIVAIHGMGAFKTMPERHWRWIMAHEIGHQYWGEYVLERDTPGWLWTGLGLYADYRYALARNLGTAKHDEILDRYRQAVLKGIDTTVAISQDRWRQLDFDYNNIVQHGKSFAILRALACVLGEEEFERVYLRCLKEYGGKCLGAYEFQTLCEQETGQDLGWFFDQWVRSNRYLSYCIKSHDSSREGDRFTSTVRVERVGSLRMPIPVAVRFADGSTTVAFTHPQLDKEVLTFTGPSPIAEVQLDPNRQLLLVDKPPATQAVSIADEIDRLKWTDDARRALELFRRKAHQHPDVPANLSFKLGMALYDGKCYEEAMEVFTATEAKAEDTSSYRFGSLVWQGHVLDLLGRRDEALGRYRAALKVANGHTMRHDQYHMSIDEGWVRQRLQSPFSRD